MKFKFLANNTLLLLAENLNFKFRIVFWNIYFLEIGRFEKEIALSEKNIFNIEPEHHQSKFSFSLGWPDEASRHLYVKATSEIPLLQDTLCHLFVIGISKQHPINGRDVIDLIDVLVKKAAGLHPLIADDFQVSAKSPIFRYRK